MTDRLEERREQERLVVAIALTLREDQDRRRESLDSTHIAHVLHLVTDPAVQAPDLTSDVLLPQPADESSGVRDQRRVNLEVEHQAAHPLERRVSSRLAGRDALECRAQRPV